MGENLTVEKQFGEYCLVIWDNHPSWVERLRLLHLNIELHVEQRSLEVLYKLLSHPPNTLILEEDIARAVWGPLSLVNNVEEHVTILRRHFKDDFRKPRFIGTVHRKGYKFLLPYKTNQRTIKSDSLGNLQNPEEIENAFDEFFGVSAENHDGVIILQSDLIDAALGDDARPQERFYKARTFVNTWDLYGANAIQETFQKQKRQVPRLILSDHNIKDTTSNSAAFKISMGLGFTDETTKAIQNQNCGKWMRISKSSGDAVSLLKKLLPPKKSGRIKSEVDAEKRDFCRLLPIDWNINYVQDWRRMLPPTNGPEVRDYAMIFRHTRETPFRQVLFVVAGFTERSTGIAGKYLEKNWKTLWETHVKGQARQSSLGDFLIIIEGPSDSESAPYWSEAKEFQVTPQKLRDRRIKCEWSERLATANRE